MNAKAMQPPTWGTGRRTRVLVWLLLLVAGLGNLVTPTSVAAQSATVCESKFGGAMVGYWRYDNGADPMQPTYGSLRGNIVGAVPLSSGKIGQALTFNGGAYVDYGTGMNIPAWDQYTVAIWFLNDGRLPPQIGYGQKIIDKTTWFSDFFLGVQNSPNPVRPPQLVFMYDRDFKNIQTSGYNYVDSRWHHAVILRNGLHGELWVDGVLIGAKEDVNPTINNHPLWMGYSSAEDGYQQQYWGGLLDEFAVFNRALSAEEIVDLYDRSAAGESYCDAAGALLVNSVADPGDGVCTGAECTLHEALAAANASAGADTITFNIPGAGPHTIKLTTPLPRISDTVLLDGYSQPGAQPASSADPAALDAVILIEIDGSALTAPGQTVAGEGLLVESTGSIIRGLAINRFIGPAIYLHAGADNLITGNFLGTDVGGTQALPNESGISVFALASGSPNRLAGNLISGNRSGIRIDQASNVLVERNRIGLGLQGAPLGNTGSGIFIAESTPVTIEGNLIAHNSSGVLTSRAGPRLFANTITANGVGVNYATDGACPAEGNHVAGNQGDGMNLRCGNASNIRNNQLTDNGGAGLNFSFRGSLYRVEGNTITGNGGHGLVLREPAPPTSAVPFNWVIVGGNTIAHNGKDGIAVPGWLIPVWQFARFSGNAIYDNGELGIDLGDDGVTVNDGGSDGPPDRDSGPNFLLNYPLLGIVGSDGAELFAYTSGWLNNRTLGVELFASPACDPSGYGEGERPVGGVTLTKDDFGRLINHWFTFPVAVPPGSVLTATATDFFIPTSDSRVSFTSEFSPCRLVAGVINHQLKLIGVTTSYDPALTWPRAPAGTFTIAATFQNVAGVPLTGLFFRVKTLTNNNRLVDVIGGPGDPLGVGAVQVGPTSVATGETFTARFQIGLAERKPFTFLVDTYGVSAAGYATTAAMTTGFTYTTTAEDLPTVSDQGHPIYLPLFRQ